MTGQTVTQGALDKNPENVNQLAPQGFQFQIKKLPNVNFFLQTADIPEITLPDAVQLNPFVDIKHPGNKVAFADLNVTFKVDEDLKNYIELHNWITKIGFAQNTQDYAEVAGNPAWTGLGILSDASILITSGLKNPNVEFVFQDCWPAHLSGFQFTSREKDVQYITASVTFKYLRFTILPLPKSV